MRWRDLRERAAISTGNFTKLFDQRDVPPFSRAAARLLQALGQVEIDFAEIAQIISSDAGLAARVLRIVNSAYFGIPKEITNVRQAITLLGLSRIRSLTLGLSAIQSLPAQEEFDASAFWQDSLQKGIFAEVACKRLGWSGSGEAFTGALLQNLAMPILLTRWAKHYRHVFEAAQTADEDLAKAEDRELSWNHAQAGAWIARNWRFPDVLVCCIGLHHAHLETLQSLKLIGTPVNAVAASAHLQQPQFAASMLGVDEGSYQEICQRTDESNEEMSQLFGLPQGQPLTAV